ncbi:hypothetical protein LAZ67_1002424 [Cordylochernes scorpioides]|uniref:Uncharacterized protein n=1 Tax=Cordylochernes scorpioides TaxID=51811 RepID=A0ABY6JWW5_9ARAC|nr:hypothetical protein LAZ67_1002424 [Cordylochernes scorpioides]
MERVPQCAEEKMVFLDKSLGSLQRCPTYQDPPITMQMMKFDKIMKDEGISFKTKKRIVETLVFPVVTYKCDAGLSEKKKELKLFKCGHGVLTHECHRQIKGQIFQSLIKLILLDP